MRIFAQILITAAAIAALNACGGEEHFRRDAETAARTFAVSPGGDIPDGFADLTVVASFKMHTPGMYLLDRSSHGLPDYVLLVNIDGQGDILIADLINETMEITKDNPESGEGIRYSYRRRYRMPAGSHTVTLSLPEDGISAKRAIVLKEGSSNTIEIEPFYRKKRTGSLPNKRVFYRGIQSIGLIFNGERL